ncbi:MAG: hypothetical protein A3J49_04740 [Gallionellales bacterium RIFCSPHIGHO2_02_FULL_57_16]|nr:MAG: hypothetical protein A3J49_04740 [Gallionellales bacterium RIFCSPHIGHO2_02_FULL_57_16]
MRGFGSEEAVPGRRIQAADPPPEVQLERHQAHAHVIALGLQRSAGDGCTGRGQRGIAGSAKIDIGQAVGLLDAVLRARLCDPCGRYAQIAIVLQRRCDQRLQARIGEVIAPAGDCDPR